MGGGIFIFVTSNYLRRNIYLVNESDDNFLKLNGFLKNVVETVK